jgi:hypothetical protein
MLNSQNLSQFMQHAKMGQYSTNSQPPAKFLFSVWKRDSLFAPTGFFFLVLQR